MAKTVKSFTPKPALIEKNIPKKIEKIITALIKVIIK